MKTCSKCKRELPATTEYFHRGEGYKDGLFSQCKRCKSKYRRKHRKEHNEYMREYQREHKKQINKNHREYRRKHRKQHNKYQQKFRQKHREQYNEYQRKYYWGHREQYKKLQQEYRKTIKGYLSMVYSGINQRCNNPKHKSYNRYGGRGIENEFNSPDDFRGYVMNELGYNTYEKIKGLQIDRIDNDGHYERGNIRFVTPKVNSNNRD